MDVLNYLQDNQATFLAPTSVPGRSRIVNPDNDPVIRYENLKLASQPVLLRHDMEVHADGQPLRVPYVSRAVMSTDCAICLGSHLYVGSTSASIDCEVKKNVRLTALEIADLTEFEKQNLGVVDNKPDTYNRYTFFLQQTYEWRVIPTEVLLPQHLALKRANILSLDSTIRSHASCTAYSMTINSSTTPRRQRFNYHKTSN